MNHSRNRRIAVLGLLVALAQTGCQTVADRYIDSYMERNGPQVLAKIQNRQRQMDSVQMEEQFAQQLKNPVNIPTAGSPSKGPEQAPITLVEFSDFECPFCSRVVPTLKQLLEEYPTQIRIVFKHMPLPMHKNARLAAQATIAAQNQGMFWEMHDKIFENQRSITESSVKEWARELKLNVGKFIKDMNAPATLARIEDDMRIAGSVGARSTPTFYMNGAQIRGALPLDAWRKFVAKALAR